MQKNINDEVNSVIKKTIIFLYICWICENIDQR